ncbi:MAG: hypothetical protein M3296_05755 [Actinomycetota bacterium]|nr:hypothetical protein [Actinomycetota bacterium]
MLFDLRGRGRRRTVQVIYLSLALLMGGGLVLFGIGSNTSGGLFDAFKQDSGSTSADKQVARQIQRAERAARLDPRNPRPLAQVVRLRYQAAGLGDGFDQSTGTFTAKGKAKLRAADRAWQRYLALAPAHPDDEVAGLMVQAYSTSGLNQPAKAVRAQEIVTQERKPTSSNLFAALAQLAYQAGQTRKGDLAAQRAVELAPKSQRSLTRQQLEQLKTQAAQQRGGRGSATATTG